jgi:stearoyl-CoA desaturase (Delta-9 desaturase)
MANFVKLRVIYLLCHVGFLAALFIGSTNWWIGSFITYLIIQIVGVGTGLHRYVAHQSFKTSRFWHYIILFLATISALGSPLSWAAIHRQHHRTSDSEQDPHSYHQMGIFKILSGDFNKETRLSLSIIKNLLRDSSLKWIHNHYYKIILTWALFLLIVKPLAFIFIFCVPLFFVYWVTILGLILNHSFGYRNFATRDRSVNSWLHSLLTLGDGWHNNHHQNPGHFSNRVRWWEFDVYAAVIMLLREKGNTTS